MSRVATVTALEVVVVNFLDSGVKVRFSHLHSAILVVESLCSYSLKINGISYVLRLDRLTAAVYATAGASHYLNEGPVCLALSDLIHNRLSVLSAGSNANLDIHTCNIVNRFLDAVGTAYLVEFKLGVILAGENVVSGTESCLHNAAGSTEDNSRTGVNAESGIEFLVGKSSELDAGSADHLSKLTGGKCNVNVNDAFACRAHIISAYLELLSGTGHNGYNEDILRIVAHLISPVGLDKSAAHLLRRFARGKVVDHIGVVKLAELNPSGRARGDHRKSAAVLNALKKLGSLFNDGEVSRGVGIKYLLEAKSSECRNHFALNVGSDRHIEALSESSSDRGSGLYYNVLCRIVKSFPNLIGIVTLNKRAGRTNCGTLSARDTGSVSERKIECLSDAGIDTTVVSTDNGNVLLFANCYAATAKDTLIVISYKVRSGVIKLIYGLEAFKGAGINAVLKAKLLKLAVGGTGAGEAVLVVSGEDKLESGLSCFSYLCGVGLDLHTLGNGVNASGNKSASAGSLNNADTASTDLVLFFHIAESGDFHACFAGSFQNSGALRYAYSNTVNCNI